MGEGKSGRGAAGAGGKRIPRSFQLGMTLLSSFSAPTMISTAAFTRFTQNSPRLVDLKQVLREILSWSAVEKAARTRVLNTPTTNNVLYIFVVQLSTEG